MNKTLLFVITGATAGFIAITAHAQSSDALVDKLVEKGILTVKEANDLREEADKDFTKAYAAKSGMQEWVQALKFNGDLRLRYDSISVDDPAFIDRSRLRYRLRYGATAALTDNFELGIRLTSGEKPSGSDFVDPISGNASFQDNGAKKNIAVDLAYAKWSPINSPTWSASSIGGKMENPFVFSDIVFDPDYTLEGFAQQVGYTINDKHSLKFAAGGFVLDELAAKANDPYFIAAQLRWDALWSQKFQSSIGVAGLALSGSENLTTANVPNVNRGNTRTAAGALVYDYNPITVDGAVTYNLESMPYYNGAFPIRLAGTVLNNPAAPHDNSAYEVGITFGKAGKRRTWEIGYRYKSLEKDSWYEEFVDSDTGAYYKTAPVGGSAGYGPGTNLRGHWIRAAWSPYDALTLSATCYIFHAINPSPIGSDAEARRFQLDAMLKF
jgi:hypothetical protein